jgi:hypothetical protein
MKLGDKLNELGRRLWRRVPTGIPVDFDWNGRRFSARCRNVSLGGAFIETDVELPLGSTVMLRLSRPHVVEDITLEAEVRWHELGGAGLRFAQPTTRDIWVLSAIVK